MQPIPVHYRVAAGRQGLHVFQPGSGEPRVHPGSGRGHVGGVGRQGAHAGDTDEGDQLVDRAALILVKILFPVHG